MATGKKLVGSLQQQPARVLPTEKYRIFPEQRRFSGEILGMADKEKGENVTKSNEQLSKETDVLFNKLDSNRDTLSEINLKISKMDGQVESLVGLMQDAISHLPSAYEHKVKYEQVCKQIDKIEQTYVSKEEFKQFRADFKGLQKWLAGIAAAFLIPMAGIAVKVIFGG